MPLIHRLLYALRTLADDEPPPTRKKHSRDKTQERSSSRHRQAVALVITFRDLFASGGLGFLLEDMEANRSSRKTKHNNSQCSDTSKSTLKDECRPGIVSRSFQSKVEMCETLKAAFESELPLATSDSTNFLADSRDNAVALLHDEQIIASSGLSNCSAVESPSRLLVPVNQECGALELYGRKRHKNLTVPLYAEDENKTVDALRKVLKWSPRKQSLAKFFVPLPKEEEHKAVAVVQNAAVESPSRLLVPANPESGALEVYGRKRYKNLTVPLYAEDENKTVDALRKVLKWSPRKQSLAKFSVPLPKEEEHKAVAVVQNAVNRVKEEQQQKRRRKFKLFKITFC